MATVLAAVGLALFALGLAILPLQTPGFTRTLAERYSLAEEAGLPRERILQVAEMVRAYVVRREGALPSVVDTRSGFDAEAVAHLDDVAVVLAAARLAVGVIGLVLAVAAVAAWRCGHPDRVATALTAGAVATLALPLVAGAVAAVDFEAFFAAFHALFFASGTWTFPYDSLLIRTFPEPFWVASGLAWAMLVVLMAAVYALAGAAVRRAVPAPRRGARQAPSD